jgi:tetratricopeptide (TPR) repeat protein
MIMEQYAMCLLVEGEFERAAELLEQSLSLCLQDEVHAMYPASAIHLGVALLKLGASERARTLIDSVDTLALARAGHYATTYKLLAQSEWLRVSGDLPGALERARAAQRETAQCAEHGFHVQALIQLADVLADQQDNKGALAAYDEAVQRADELGMRPWLALAWQGRGQVLQRRAAASTQANAALDRAAELWHELDAPKRHAHARALRQRSG